jgi:hypothetical protein
MLKLPFHFDRPFETAVLVGCASLLFAGLWWANRANFLKIGNVLSTYFQRRWGASGPEKAQTAASVFLGVFAVLFACSALFGMLIAFGVIENGDKRKPKIPAESSTLQDYLQSENGKVDVKELIRQNEAKREQTK